MDANMDLLVDIIQEQQRKYEMFGFGSHLICGYFSHKYVKVQLFIFTIEFHHKN